jgi:dephospho-CoA kinase
MKLIVGLTGGIGSGKSEVARLFKILGAATYAADETSKFLLDHNSALKNKLIDAFGNQVYQNSKLNRKFFASLIFQNNNSIALANSIIHPFVFKDFENWIQNQPNCKYIVMEAAILFESRANDHLNKIITVYSPAEVRISRVMKRDNCNREDVLRRMHHQIPDEEKIKLSDFVIYNDEQHMVIPQVLELHRQFVALTQ